MNDDRVWVEDNSELQAMAVQFYTLLFTADAQVGGDFILGQFPKHMAENIKQLDAPYSMEETRKRVMLIGLLNVPGPDGLRPVFFQSN